jgi:HK97 gp10 family phage protein
MPSVPRSFKGHAGSRFSFVALNANSAINKVLSFTNRILEPALFIGLKKALLLIEREAVRLIKSGYYKPAIDTGRMWRAVTSRVLYKTHREIAGAVGVVDVYYAIYVHEGTYKMEDRPFLVDAAENMKENIISLFRGEIKNIIRVKK